MTFAGSVKITMASDGRPLVEGTGLALQIAERDAAAILGALLAVGVEPPFADFVKAKLSRHYALTTLRANDLAKTLATLGVVT